MYCTAVTLAYSANMVVTALVSLQSVFALAEKERQKKRLSIE